MGRRGQGMLKREVPLWGLRRGQGRSSKFEKRSWPQNLNHCYLRDPENFSFSMRNSQRNNLISPIPSFSFPMLPLTYRFLFLFFLIEFIGVTLLNKIIQVSDIQFYDLSSIHCIGCSPPHVKFPSVTVGHSFTLCSLHPPPLLLVITILLSVCEDLLLLLFLT